jgi:hypothetical protein
MAGRKKRKRRKPEPRPKKTTSPESGSEAPSASQPTGERRSKDDLAREQLVPLGAGERPLAITIGASISGLLGLTTIVLFAAGVDTGEADFSGGATVLYAALMLLMAWGMWTVRYWAVLGFQALLALLVIIWSLLLVKAENVLAVVIALAVIGLAGSLFWFLVKSLARIQMPERRPR